MALCEGPHDNTQHNKHNIAISFLFLFLTFSTVISLHLYRTSYGSSLDLSLVILSACSVLTTISLHLFFFLCNVSFFFV